jgi:formylglycine-generating enzyme required for sulfatase activity
LSEGTHSPPRNRLKTEVTVGQFKQFVADAPYQTEAEEYGSDFTWRLPRFRKEVQTDEHPVVYVTHNDAVKFCEWLSKKTGH